MLDIKPTEKQKEVLNSLQNFVNNFNQKVFILKGYAGTGKTTLMRFFVDYLQSKGIIFKLLAPTGRAAKVLRDVTGNDASTIHSLLYKLRGFNKDVDEKGQVLSNNEVEENGQLHLVFEAAKVSEAMQEKVVYIVDESSMISNTKQREVKQAEFGSGQLLNDLLSYDTRKQSKFIFVGDPCQLPPVKDKISPALDINTFVLKGINAQECELTEIIRQKNDNSIITASQKIREFYNNAPLENNSLNRNWYPFLPFLNSSNIIIHSSREEMVDDYTSKIDGKNYNQATFLSASNINSGAYSMLIRNKLGFKSSIVEPGDLLMVIQNNISSGLVNGDSVEVLEVNDNFEKRAGLSFRQVTVKNISDNNKSTLLLLEDTLNQKQLNIDNFQQTKLYQDFIIRMRTQYDIDPNKDFQIFAEYMQTDPYLNALRCTFGYCITCHKAQGGEWADVYVDMPRDITLNATKSKYQWVYTAMTRAKFRLHLVREFFYCNPGEEFFNKFQNRSNYQSRRSFSNRFFK